MPPKRKGPSKKQAKPKTPILIDGFTVEELSKEQIEEHIVRLQEELDRETEERNYFQLERDKIHKFYEITDNKLEEVRAENKNIAKVIEEDERRYQVEIKVYRQKMKHVLHEHQNTICEIKADALVSTQVVQEEQNKLEPELHQDSRSVKVDMQEEFDYENLVKENELKHTDDMTQACNIREKQIAEVQVKGEQKMELLQQDLDNRRKKVTSEVEDQWNTHINTLKEDHKKAFVEADALMISINPDPDMNKTLVIQLEGAEMKQKKKEEDLAGLLQENKRLTGLLSKVKEQIAGIERKMKYYTLEKSVSEQVKRKKLEQQKCYYETLEKKFCKLQLQRDELEKTSTQNIQQAQAKAERKSMLLDRQLKGLTDGLEKTHAQLLAVLSASSVDTAALDEIETYLDSTHSSIKNLEYERAKLCQARKDLLYFYEAKQRALGVPVEELQLGRLS